jgi:hypothetical protein
MNVLHISSGKVLTVQIESITEEDYKQIKRSVYYFDWKREKEHNVFKLSLLDDSHIIGLISLKNIDSEERIEIRLLAVSKENRGRSKIFEGITGNLIAFACRDAINRYGSNGCVSLYPKTALRQHYIDKYGFIDSGYHLYIEAMPMFQMIKKFEL